MAHLKESEKNSEKKAHCCFFTLASLKDWAGSGADEALRPERGRGKRRGWKCSLSVSCLVGWANLRRFHLKLLLTSAIFA